MYIPALYGRKRSLSDTLAEAEEEHFLDCPNADFLVRSASLILDGIFCYLLLSATQHLGTLIASFVPELVLSFVQWLHPEGAGDGAPMLLAWLGHFETLALYATEALKSLLVFTYTIWSIAILGGTPAKLLFGLRIVDASTGKKLSLSRVFLREYLGKPIGAFLLGSGFLLALARKDRRAFHDFLGRSVVKRVHGAR